MPRLLAIVTGSSRGLGEAIAARLLAVDTLVLGIARRRSESLEAIATTRSAPLAQWTADLAEPSAVAPRLEAWFAAHAAQAPARTVLINNAGAVATPGPFENVPDSEMLTALHASLDATIVLTAAFLRATRGFGGDRRVLNISSGLGRRAMAGSAVYCAAKAGMDHFSRAVALEQAALTGGARIVSLAPGVIDTDMQVQLRNADPARFRDQSTFASLYREGQLLSPDAAAARVLAFLDRADFGEQPVADVRDGVREVAN